MVMHTALRNPPRPRGKEIGGTAMSLTGSLAGQTVRSPSDSPRVLSVPSGRNTHNCRVQSFLPSPGVAALVQQSHQSVASESHLHFTGNSHARRRARREVWNLRTSGLDLWVDCCFHCSNDCSIKSNQTVVQRYEWRKPPKRTSPSRENLSTCSKTILFNLP